jgi:hypothetical protein
VIDGLARFARIGALGIAALVISGCSFERTVVNEETKNLDPAGIVAGRSNRLDVIKQLGVPLPDVPEQIGTLLPGKDYVKYAVSEQRCFRIGFERIFLITPFRWCFKDYPYELAVEFDDDGIVTGVYETRREMIWPPFQDEADRPPPQTVELSGSLLK